MDDQTIFDELGKVYAAVDSAKDEMVKGLGRLGERIAVVETKVDGIHCPPCDSLQNLEHHHDGLRGQVEDGRRATRNWLLTTAGVVVAAIAVGALGVLWKVIAD